MKCQIHIGIMNGSGVYYSYFISIKYDPICYKLAHKLVQYLAHNHSTIALNAPTFNIMG